MERPVARRSDLLSVQWIIKLYLVSVYDEQRDVCIEYSAAAAGKDLAMNGD